MDHISRAIIELVFQGRPGLHSSGIVQCRFFLTLRLQYPQCCSSPGTGFHHPHLESNPRFHRPSHAELVPLHRTFQTRDSRWAMATVPGDFQTRVGEPVAFSTRAQRNGTSPWSSPFPNADCIVVELPSPLLAFSSPFPNRSHCHFSTSLCYVCYSTRPGNPSLLPPFTCVGVTIDENAIIADISYVETHGCQCMRCEWAHEIVPLCPHA